MSEPAAAITSALGRFSQADARAREAAIALAVEREQRTEVAGEPYSSASGFSATASDDGGETE